VQKWASKKKNQPKGKSTPDLKKNQAGGKSQTSKAGGKKNAPANLYGKERAIARRILNLETRKIVGNILFTGVCGRKNG